MVSESPCNGEYAANSVIEDEPTFRFDSGHLLLILAVVVDGQSFCNITFAYYGSCISNIGNVEHVVGTFFSDDAHTGCRTTAVTI